jgi:hypothetical protein
MASVDPSLFPASDTRLVILAGAIDARSRERAIEVSGAGVGGASEGGSYGSCQQGDRQHTKFSTT